ncbi:MAG: hypothetical protein LBP76_07345 [Treponema sp.]|jgi:hypothetical protein|nr:hypothetical protein [Treponema sp.]
MKKDTDDKKNNRLYESVDQLTEENQRYFLGVLQALAFAQSEQDKVEAKSKYHPKGYGYDV